MKSEEKNKIVYTCPMHPEVREDNPGMCPECGMALVETATKDTGQGPSGHNCCGPIKEHGGILMLIKL